MVFLLWEASKKEKEENKKSKTELEERVRHLEEELMVKKSKEKKDD
jgi:hypothetical protein